MGDEFIGIPVFVLNNECKIGQGAASCIYGVINCDDTPGADPFQCTKHTSLGIALEQKAAGGEMTAQTRVIGCSLHKDCGCN